MNKKEAKPNIISDLKQVLSDIETLVYDTKVESEEVIENFKEQAQETLTNAKEKLSVQDFTEKSKALANTAGDYIYKNPWTAIGVAAGIGFVVGMLAGRSTSSKDSEE